MKLNPEYALFDGNMFVQMRSLLADIDLPSGTDMLDMSIGEPQVAGGDLLTGSIMIGGAVALIEPGINTVAFYFHEKLWNRLERRRHVRRARLPIPLSV